MILHVLGVKTPCSTGEVEYDVLEIDRVVEKGTRVSMEVIVSS